MNKEIKNIKMITNKVGGWLSDKEEELLYSFAKNLQGKGVIVEIGSWKGKSTIWLAKGSKKGNKVKIYAIDPHIGAPEHRKLYGKVWTFEEFKQNIKMAGVEDIIIPIVKTSQEAENGWGKEPVEFLWIDGAHDYESVHLDYKIWEPHLIEGGIIAFHDTLSGGPKKVVDRYLYRGDKFKNVNFVDGITFAEKSGDIFFKDKIKNRCVLLLRELYIFYSIINRDFFNGKLRLPKILKYFRSRINSL